MQREFDVVVCVCTYKRPHGLMGLLPKLLEAADSLTSAAVLILVVDNDAQGTAKSVTESYVGHSSRSQIAYMIAENKGLVVARNAGLEFAKACEACVVFIDDDEVPSVDWLSALWAVHRSFPQEVIAGPVIATYETSIPDWSPDGAYWQKRTYQDRELMTRFVPDSNILYPLELVISTLRYNMRYNSSGGQETELLKRWFKRGRSVVWSADAVVYETVPAGRMSVSYACDREYFGALTYTWIHSECLLEVVRQLSRGLYHLVGGSMQWTYATISRDKNYAIKSRIRLAKGRGTLAGFYRREYDRYRDYQFDVSVVDGP